MNQKHHGGPAPVPAGNQSKKGPALGDLSEDAPAPDNEGTGFQEQDVQRRLGDFTGKGEHSIQQPTKRNDGAKKSS